MPKDQPLQGTRILIAEDDAIQGFDLKMLFEANGAQVVGPARTLMSALALANAAEPTCAVLDIVLGRELVFPVAQVLKERGVGIVFLTGDSGLRGFRRDWPDAQVLAKPAPSDVLMRSIQTACPRHSHAATPAACERAAITRIAAPSHVRGGSNE